MSTVPEWATLTIAAAAYFLFLLLTMSNSRIFHRQGATASLRPCSGWIEGWSTWAAYGRRSLWVSSVPDLRSDRGLLESLRDLLENQSGVKVEVEVSPGQLFEHHAVTSVIHQVCRGDRCDVRYAEDTSKVVSE